ncbi:hypothetical protein [Brevibacillus laterosporus]|uniref:hypothetical protein n=1 Tax=Brevibacillus laterosporus TaxID=1465 RepID=UPI0018F89D5C|nr:hypothetical protein [Brevibacillus laterosporus]MBG9776151.1 hypothetical protein [Brevibacillus laterosporus]
MDLNIKQLRELSENTVVRAYYAEDGEHCMATGSLISYTPAGSFLFVAKRKGNKKVFVRKDGASKYEYSAQELMDNYENGVALEVN